MVKCMGPITLERLIYCLPVVIIATCLHELSHGYVSYRLGDPTPKRTGRLTLNPLKHLDPIGSLCLLCFGFGWAKPVQVNPRYYRSVKGGMVLTALAGPAMNFLLALIGSFVMSLMIRIVGPQLTFQTEMGYKTFLYIYKFFMYFTLLNIGLGSFNLIPFPPLDGSKVLASVLPDPLYYVWMKYERYGQLILMVILYAGLLSTPLHWMQNGIYEGMTQFTRMLLGL